MDQQHLPSSKKCTFTWKKNHKIISSSNFGLKKEEVGDNTKPKESIHRRKPTLSSAQKIVYGNTLKNEGSLLASRGKLEEAIQRWDEAVTFTPDDETIYEMKAQVLMILEKDFRAVKCAELAVAKNKLWWASWVTLGRAQMNLKDFSMATKSFSQALHVRPYNNEDFLSDMQLAVDWKKKTDLISNQLT